MYATDKFVATYSNLRSRPEATAASKRNVKNWLSTYRDAIDKEERAFIEDHLDLFSVVDSPRTPLRSVLE
jgi:hypothetical protein